MYKSLFVILFVFSFSSIASETELCTAFKQQFMDSKRFYKKDCKLDTDCALADLKWNPCAGQIALNTKFIENGLKHFIDLKEKSYAACNYKAPTCEKREDAAICFNDYCASMNETYDRAGEFKIYLKFEGKSIPPKEIVLRREHTVYCITTPCPPLTTDTKIQLVEGVLMAHGRMVPYPDISNDIRFYLVYKGYQKVLISRKKLLDLKDKTIEFKLSEKR